MSEWHLTPHQINYEWTEEQFTLMFKKRYHRLKKLAKEIEKPTGDEGNTFSNEVKPRRVTNDAFFARMAAMKAKGGACVVQRA